MIKSDIYSTLKSVLKPESISQDKTDIASFSTQNTLIDSGKNPECVARPKDAAELQSLIKKANKAKVNITLSSSNGSHYKGGIESTGSHAHVSLSSWDKIPWINRRNRVCQIEPGVTYDMLLKALKPHGMTVPMPLAPRSGKSVLASIMDREPSTWPNKQWDISDPVACIEFIFGNGELFRTGAAGGAGSLEEQRAAGGAQKNPLGPSQADFHRVLQGAQGTMGAVTWATVRTELLPRIQKSYLLGDKIEKLIPFVYEVQRPWLGEHSFILDRTAAAMLMSGKSNSFDVIRNSLPEFICMQSIQGFDRYPRMRVKYQTNDINKIAVKHNLKMKQAIGKISAKNLFVKATNVCGEKDWRHSLKGHCLSIFFLTTLDRTPIYIDMMKQVAAKYKLGEKDFGTYIQPVVQNHSCHVEFMIPYNPSFPSEVNDMKRIEKEAVDKFISNQAFFSRPYGYAGKVVFKKNPVNAKVLKSVKDIFDPQGILNKGKWDL